MARHGKNQKEYLAAEMLLKGSGLNMLDAASLAVELLSLCGGSRSMRRARKAIFLGAEELRKGERTVSFSALLYPVMFAGLFAGIKSGNMMNEGAVKKLVIVMLILSGGALVLNNL